MVPVIPEWIEQKYGYVPAVSKVLKKVPPLRFPEFQGSSPVLVVVWVPWTKAHPTEPPTVMVRLGLLVNWLLDTWMQLGHGFVVVVVACTAVVVVAAMVVVVAAVVVVAEEVVVAAAVVVVAAAVVVVPARVVVVAADVVPVTVLVEVVAAGVEVVPAAVVVVAPAPVVVTAAALLVVVPAVVVLAAVSSSPQAATESVRSNAAMTRRNGRPIVAP
jgi:hypothetical protein